MRTGRLDWFVATEEIDWVNAKRLRDLLNNAQRGVALAAFDLADIGVSKVGFVRQRF